jgi:DNA sulfur modification protein DndC
LAYLKDLYRRDSRPWVIAFSGGKDSTLVLQLVCNMLEELRPQEQKPVYVIACDTRVEAPNIIDYLQETLERIRTWSEATGLSLTTHVVQPTTDETFWAKLIGKGYPSPTRGFRWCTTAINQTVAFEVGPLTL